MGVGLGGDDQPESSMEEGKRKHLGSLQVPTALVPGQSYSGLSFTKPSSWNPLL